MKRFVLFMSSMFFAFALVSSFAQASETPQLQEKPSNPNPQNRVVLQGGGIAKVISAENDKSKPPKSSIQNYQLVYETTKGENVKATLQIEWGKNEEILKAAIVNIPKGYSAPIVKPRCPDGCEFRCVRMIEFHPPRSYLVCVCIGGPQC